MHTDVECFVSTMFLESKVNFHMLLRRIRLQYVSAFWASKFTETDRICINDLQNNEYKT